jgi:septum formation protein
LGQLVLLSNSPLSESGSVAAKTKLMPLKTNCKAEWILASVSPRRREILEQLGLQFRVEPSGIQEPARKIGETPSGYAVRVARLKAGAIAARNKSGFIIGVDTIVVLRNSILGKPESRVEAQEMLRKLSGRWHEVLSGICLIDCTTHRARSAFGRSRVHFRRLAPQDIRWYLRTGEYRDKAGAYGVQGYASLFIDRIEGCYFNIVGFPISAFQRLCGASGVDVIRELTPLSLK